MLFGVSMLRLENICPKYSSMMMSPWSIPAGRLEKDNPPPLPSSICGLSYKCIALALAVTLGKNAVTADFTAFSCAFTLYSDAFTAMLCVFASSTTFSGDSFTTSAANTGPYRKNRYQ